MINPRSTLMSTKVTKAPTKDTVLYSPHLQTAISAPGLIRHDKAARRLLRQHLLEKYPYLKGLTNDDEVVFGVPKEDFLLGLTNKEFLQNLEDLYSKDAGGQNQPKMTNGLRMTARGVFYENCFDISADSAVVKNLGTLGGAPAIDNIGSFQMPLDGDISSIYGTIPYYLGRNPIFQLGGISTPTVFKPENVFCYTIPFVSMNPTFDPTTSTSISEAWGNSIFPDAPEIALHAMHIICNPLADDSTEPVVAGWDRQMDKATGALKTLSTEEVSYTKKVSRSLSCGWVPLNSMSYEVPEAIKDIPGMAEKYLAARREMDRNLDWASIWGTVKKGLGGAVKGVLNVFAGNETNASLLSKLCRVQTKGAKATNGGAGYLGQDGQGNSFVIAGGARATLRVLGQDEIIDPSIAAHFPGFEGLQYVIDYSNMKSSEGVFIKTTAKVQMNPCLNMVISPPYGYIQSNESNKKELRIVQAAMQPALSKENLLEAPSGRTLIIPVLFASRYAPSDPKCFRTAVPLTNPAGDYSTVLNAFQAKRIPMRPAQSDDSNTYFFGSQLSFNYDNVIALDCSFFVPDQLPDLAVDGSLELKELKDGEMMYVFMAIAQEYAAVWPSQPVSNLAASRFCDYSFFVDEDSSLINLRYDPSGKLIESLNVAVQISLDNKTLGKAVNHGLKWEDQEGDDDHVRSGFHVLDTAFSTEVTAPVINGVVQPDT